MNLNFTAKSLLIRNLLSFIFSIKFIKKKPVPLSAIKGTELGHSTPTRMQYDRYIWLINFIDRSLNTVHVFIYQFLHICRRLSCKHEEERGALHGKATACMLAMQCVCVCDTHCSPQCMWPASVLQKIIAEFSLNAINIIIF